MAPRSQRLYPDRTDCSPACDWWCAGKNFLIGFVVASIERGAQRKRLHIDADDIIDKTQFTPAFETAAEFYSEEHLEKAPSQSYIIVPSTFEPGIHDVSKQGDYELMVYTDDDRASLVRIEPSTWHLQELTGEWSPTQGTAGGCRNYPTWVKNPLYTLRASRPANCQLFLRQPTRPDVHDEPAEYPGIGFYIVNDDGSLSLEDVICESGFRCQVWRARTAPQPHPHTACRTTATTAHQYSPPMTTPHPRSRARLSS